MPADPYMALRALLGLLAGGERLDEMQAERAFGMVLDGVATPAQLGGMLMAMRVRGETSAELAGAARAMRLRMRRVVLDEADRQAAVDVCGTGGDGAGTLNISTAVAFVVAGAGVPVCKHGNRAASSRSGGADVLAELGVRLDPPPERLGAILREAGCVFLFAPRHHEGLRHAALPRAELGVRTMFNLLGPLANPACVQNQLVGVFDAGWQRPMAEALARIGNRRSWVVHGRGLDELSLVGPNQVVEQRGAVLRSFTLRPETLELATARLDDIAGGDVAENAACLLELMQTRPPEGTHGRRRYAAYRDTVLLNAAAALVVASDSDDLTACLDRARAALDGGAALEALTKLRAASRRGL